MSTIIDGTNGISYPSWTTSSRPTSPNTGETGYNTTLGLLETWGGAAWLNSGNATWTTTARNAFASPATGLTGYNTTLGVLESYNGTAWVSLANNAAGSGITFATWTTATRPGSPATGQTGYNTTTGTLEVYNSTTTSWSAVGQSNITYSASYLVVAGGGSTPYGSAMPGGGGAGGLISGTVSLILGTQYTFIVGAGGSVTIYNGTQGSFSQAFGLTAIGGGAPDNASYSNFFQNGGSGAGGFRANSSGGTIFPGGLGTTGQGNAGGSGSNSGGTDNYGSGGGGGGAGAVGTAASGSTAGNGGVGLISTIITASMATTYSIGQVVSSSVYFAGGGGGGSYGGTGGTGGYGGGGLGTNSNSPAGAGSANSGGGAGAAGYTNGVGPGVGANGGSGVVILSIPTASYSGNIFGSPTVTTNGSNTILIFKSSGSYTA
jgi:hypothetical protein